LEQSFGSYLTESDWKLAVVQSYTVVLKKDRRVD